MPVANMAYIERHGPVRDQAADEDVYDLPAGGLAVDPVPYEHLFTWGMISLSQLSRLVRQISR